MSHFRRSTHISLVPATRSGSQDTLSLYRQHPDVLGLTTVAAVEAEQRRIERKAAGLATSHKRERLSTRLEALAARHAFLSDEATQKAADRRARRIGYIDSLSTVAEVTDALTREKEALVGQTIVSGFEDSYPGEIGLTKQGIARLESRQQALVAAEAAALVERRPAFLAALGEHPTGANHEHIWLMAAHEIAKWRVLAEATGTVLDPSDIGPYQARAAKVRALSAAADNLVQFPRSANTEPVLALAA